MKNGEDWEEDSSSNGWSFYTFPSPIVEPRSGRPSALGDGVGEGKVGECREMRVRHEEGTD